MRSEVIIPACAGAEIFLNQGGNITVKQYGIDGEHIIVLSRREATLVADALREVVGFLASQQPEGE